MANHKKLIPFILKWEGGFSNDPDDKGGATMKGITLNTYKAYCKKNNLPEPTVEDLKNITNERWEHLFKTMFWDKWRGDEIQSQSVANILVDWLWASGTWGILIPQRLLNVKVDGIVGPKTIEALNKQDAKTFFETIKKARIDFVNNIVANNPSQKKFLKGWMNRINDLKWND